MNADTDPKPSLVPIIIGFVLAGVFILGLGFWVSRRQPRDAQVPEIRLLTPATDTTIAGPITVRFQTEADLKLQSTGWGAGRYHLHALLDSTELMPAAADIAPAGDGTFTWTLPAIAAPSALQLKWSLPNHQRLDEGASRVVRISPR